MSTRATITFEDKDKPLVKLYIHGDGYIEGLGYELAEWLLTKEIGNGITPKDMHNPNYCNGLGCLAARFIAEHKLDNPGYLYIDYIDSTNEWIDYNYRIIFDYELNSEIKKKCNEACHIIITNFDYPEVIFKGTPEELLNFKESEDDY